MVVLSNNDGCAVSRSNEVKALGVKMGTPWFKMKELASQHGILAFSSNYTLYGDMSNRVITILSEFAPDIEVYSIDESFLQIESVAHLYGGAQAMGQQMRQRIRQWIGLPVCVGIGPTKTLAKLANHLAKKNAVFDGVCDLQVLSRPERLQWMAGIDVGEVWGVGRRIAIRLKELGILSVRDLRNASPKEIRTHFGVVMERTCNELRGLSCLDLEDVAPAKQQIMSSRSFGAPVEALVELREAVATYVASAAAKLREQGSESGAIYVFVQTNRFREDDVQYNAGLTVPLEEPSDDTLVLIKAALNGLEKIYRPGFRYKKAGITLTLLTDKTLRQETLFDDPQVRAKSKRLMAVIDAVNQEYGRETLRSGASGIEKNWATRAELRSPRYTSRWEDLPVAQ